MSLKSLTAIGIVIGCVCLNSNSDDALLYSDNIIEKSWNIVWARCVSAELTEKNWYVTYNFEVIETLRGVQRSEFSLNGRTVDWQRQETEMSSFRGHTDSNFWEKIYISRCDSDDCGPVIRIDESMSFIVGWEYLILMDKPYSRRSFEEVSNKKDKWYLYVKQKVKEQREQEEDIRINAQWAQACITLSDLTAQYPDEDFQKICRLVRLSIYKNSNITNAEIKKMVEEIVRRYKQENGVSGRRGNEAKGSSKRVGP